MIDASVSELLQNSGPSDRAGFSVNMQVYIYLGAMTWSHKLIVQGTFWYGSLGEWKRRSDRVSQ